MLFLVFAASMMLFYKPKKKEEGQSSGGKELKTGIGLGIGAGYLGGLLGEGSVPSCDIKSATRQLKESD